MNCNIVKRSLPEIFKNRPVFRTRDAEGQGITRTYLLELEKRGEVERLARGIWALAGYEPSENHSLAIVGVAVPEARICLLTALRFHGLTTQNPHEIWIAVGVKDWKPKLKFPPLRVNRFSGAAWDLGLEEHRVDGVPIKVYSVAKTIVDLFRYRKKIGIDVGLEALREGWRVNRFTMDEIVPIARACRMQRIMHPYLESLVV
jgi:predicted transcriptional regulator of viral defense system